MGNNICNGTDTIDDQMKEADLNIYSNLFIRNKIKTQSARLSEIYSVKQADNKEEFILSTKPYNDLEAEDSVSVTLQNKDYESMGLFGYTNFLNQNEGINYQFEIEEQVIRDINQENLMITRATDKNTNEKYTLKIINFDHIQDYQFKQGIYEIAIHNKLKNAYDGESHPNILQLKDSFILHCKERQQGKKCLIMVFEYFDATLTEIISFRNKNKWKFSNNQIAAVLRDLLSALHLMHHLGIVHRDIRPCNIYYVASDKSYKLAGFSEAKIQENFALEQQIRKINAINQNRNNSYNKRHGIERLNTLRGVPEFQPPEILHVLHANSVQKVLSYDPFKVDLYCLGLMAVLMDRHQIRLEAEDVSDKIKTFKRISVPIQFSDWNLSHVVKHLVSNDLQARKQAHEWYLYCKQKFPNDKFQKPVEDSLVQSLRFKTQKDNKEFYLSDQHLIAQEYYNMYNMEKWLYKLSEILEEFVQTDQEIKKADVYCQIGEGYLQHNNHQDSVQYFEKAAYIYNSLGHEFTTNCNFDPAVNYYTKALDCVRKSHNGEETSEQAQLLENMGNAYRAKGELNKGRAFLEEALLMIANVKGEITVEVARMLNNIGNVYAQLGFYKKAEKRLKRALRISEQIYLDQEEKLKLQALCMCNLGEIHRLKGSLTKAKNCLEESLQIREELLGSGHLQVAENVENLGNVYFDMGDYHKARKNYERSLVIKRSKLAPDNPEIALTLNNIGNVCKNMEEVDKAKKMYDDALYILQQKFGNDAMHPFLAMTFGNLGIINIQNFNQQIEGVAYINRALEILEYIVGIDHDDYQFYASFLPQNYYNNQQEFVPQSQLQYQQQQQYNQQQHNYISNNIQSNNLNLNNNNMNFQSPYSRADQSSFQGSGQKSVQMYNNNNMY